MLVWRQRSKPPLCLYPSFKHSPSFYSSTKLKPSPSPYRNPKFSPKPKPKSSPYRSPKLSVLLLTQIDKVDEKSSAAGGTASHHRPYDEDCMDRHHNDDDDNLNFCCTYDEGLAWVYHGSKNGVHDYWQLLLREHHLFPLPAYTLLSNF